MRIFLIFLVGLVLAGEALAKKNDKQLGLEDQAKVAVGVFRNACVVNYGDRNKAMQFLDERYIRHKPEKRQQFLDFVHSKGGEVWAAILPKGEYVIVLEDTGNCHVIAGKADEATIHQELKTLALDVRDSMTWSVVDYKGLKKDGPVSTTSFEVKAPDGTVVVAVVATTLEKPVGPQPAAVISMAVSKKKIQEEQAPPAQ